MKSIKIKSILGFLDKRSNVYEFLGNEEDEILGFSSITIIKKIRLHGLKRRKLAE